MPAKKGKSSSGSAKKKSAPKKSKSPSASKKKSKDWFAELDAELQKKTDQAIEVGGGDADRKEELNRTIIADFWKVVLRFEKINIHFSIEPAYNQFAQFEKFPFQWELKDNFDYGALNEISIADKTQAQSRVGDTLNARYYMKDDTLRFRMTFNFCEGEHYYKYSGWKRIYSEYIAYDSAIKSLDLDTFHSILADIVRAWYESHLRRDRDHFLEFMAKSYEKGETITK